MAVPSYTVVEGGSIITPRGFQAAGLHCGLKKTERNDIGAIVCEVPAAAAAVYTTNIFQAAPLQTTRESLANGVLRAVIVNSGNANACTGKQGDADAYEMRALAAESFGVDADDVAVASTGVIGENLKMDRVRDGIARLSGVLSSDANGGEQFSQSILTTDLVKKELCVTVQIDGKPVVIAGAAKGSGMIHPNMATMLGYIATDAAVAQPLLQQMVREAANRSFNCITVDGDTSTNDALMLIATGKRGAEINDAGSTAYAQLEAAVIEVATHLAQAIVRDGEGATKFITIRIEGGNDEAECKQIGYAIAHSPLVKTAFFASDPNLGRILAAIGYAGVGDLDVDRLSLYLDDVLVAENGGRATSYQEEDGQRVMQQSDITIRVVLNRGAANATLWTCDFSYDYVKINASYRS